MDDRNAPKVNRDPINCWNVLWPAFVNKMMVTGWKVQLSYINAVAAPEVGVGVAKHSQEPRHGLKAG